MLQKIIPYFFTAIISLFSLTIHEYSHGYIAYKLGDDTAKTSGRLTLNPIKHIDLVGLLMLIVFRVGWAKPVPVNPNKLYGGYKSMIKVAFAGPLSNIFIAIIASILFRISYILNLYYFSLFWYYTIALNIGYAVFNLIPIPPLDGSRLIYLSNNLRLINFIAKYERYSFILLYFILKIGLLNYVITPIIKFVLDILV